MDEFTANEFSKRYRDTLIITPSFSKKGDSQALYVEGVNNVSGRYICTLHNGSNRSTINLDTLEITEYPSKMCFNGSNGYTGVFLYSRKALRQWRRGFVNDNTSIVSMLGHSVHMFGGKDFTLHEPPSRKLGVDFGILNCMAASKDRKYVGIEDITTFEPDQLQKCLTREYWISRGADDNDIVLFKFDTPIGVLSKSRMILSSTIQPFKQECLDFISRNGLSNVVEVI